MCKKLLAGVFILGSAVIPQYAQRSLVPIVEMKFRGLLGGVQNGRWVAPAMVAPKIKTEIEFVLAGLKGVEEGGVTFGKKGEKEDVCEDFQRMEFELKMSNGVAIGTGANWNPVPRIPKTIDPNNATYKQAVAAFLIKKGVVRLVRIKQAFRIDLEGDGVEEVLLAATYYKNGLSSSAAAGDYSFVMLRTARGRVVTNHLLDGDFVTRKVRFGAPTEHHISAIADLNGDGLMEIVLNGSYYEGDFASAYELKKGKPVKIKEFSIACGV